MKRLTLSVALGLSALASAALAGGDSKSQRVIVLPTPQAQAGAADPQVLTLAQTGASSVWVGVRLSPAPEALAAHLGRDGMMVVNIVEDSPAAAAGLERFDVLVSLNGSAINELGDLTAALEAVGADKPATLVVLRRGAERTITITPAKRPADAEPRFKYDEPANESVRNDVRYFGHRLRQDPQGNWMFEPLGRLFDIPNDVRLRLNDVNPPAWQDWMQSLKSLQLDPFRMNLQVDPDNQFFLFPDSSASDEAYEVQIKTYNGGVGLSIQRDKDGHIHVTRENADGVKTEVDYDSLEQLQQQDAEAYAAFRRYAGFRARTMIQVPPDMKNLDQLQQDFQARIERLLRDAADTSAAVDQQMQRARELADRIRSWQSDGSGGGVSRSESRSISIGADGIRITVSVDGDTRTYEFDNVEQFKREEPELYEQFKDSFKDD